MRMLVVGAGSTGGYFGGRLAQAGRDVTFLVRPGRAAHLRANGLQVVSPHGDFTLAPQLVTADSIDGTYDAVLVTVKAFSLEAGLADMAPAVGPDTMVLPVLNGMKHLDRMAERFGAPAVVGCVCKVGTSIDAEGRIIQLNRMQELAYGELDGQPSARTERLDAFLRDAGFDARLTPTITRELWEKWLLLAALGGATCTMRGTIGDIAATPDGEAFVNRLIDEVVAVVEAVGQAPGPGYVAGVRATMTAKGSPGASSMYRDLTAGNAVEADQIVGDLLDRGRKAGLDTPLLAAAYTHLCVYQNRLGRA